MSSSGTILAMTPLLPWRPAILSPTESLRFIAMKAFTVLMTPGGSSSPLRSLAIFSSVILRSTSTWRVGFSFDVVNLLEDQRVLFLQPHALEVAGGDAGQDLAGELGALGEQALVGFLVVQVAQERLALEQLGQALQPLVLEDGDLVLQVLFQLGHLGGFDLLVALVLLRALAGEDLDVHHHTLDARRAVEGGVADVAGLLPEDGAQQLLLR